MEDEEYECIICTEIPLKVMETSCWGTLIWDKWGVKLKECPNKWTKNLELRENNFIQRKINQIPVKWEFWEESIPRKTISAHQSICNENPVKPAVMNNALHSCILSMKEKKDKWYCESWMMVGDGCVTSGKEISYSNKGIAWNWVNCNIDFCKGCIVKYSNVKDKEALKMLSKSTIHLTHKHKLDLILDKNVRQRLQEHWIGKYRKSGWARGEETARLFACESWRVLICEFWYLSEQEEFVEFTSSDFHEHLLHVTAVAPNDLWKCDGGLENWLKGDTYLNREWKICYRCDIWSFSVWSEWLKKKKVKL